MRIVLIGVVAALIVAAGVYLIIRPGRQETVAVHPPITPTATGTADAGITIPEGFLRGEELSRRPLDQPEVRWVRTDEPGLPSLLSPCGTQPGDEAGRAAGRQMALVAPTLYKIERMVIYRDESAAARAMDGYRDALTRCARHPEPDGATTVWIWEPLDIGDEALFLAGQRYEGDRGTHGHHRGVLTRKGRTVLMYVDFGQATTIADRSEVALYEQAARDMADKIASAPWS
ncbi:MAG TPA: hypothetical protein VGX25_12860 [Actinophytocola sp.]|uniref:hypothetical protein n=1 Tax=Actinophytocola sp. TaxID=1872138 RepID=UPI002DDD1C01|nr:hypothetical protein [Actinophytocola sp.]HEV2780275.1 hypothetical protein [Actinophytocola sp.]